jgi:hypothetical protein
MMQCSYRLFLFHVIIRQIVALFVNLINRLTYHTCDRLVGWSY